MDITRHDKDPGISGTYKSVYGNNTNTEIKKEDIKEFKTDVNSTDKVVDFSFVKDNTTISNLLQEQFSWKE
ncbi:hypothetical protein ACVWU4_000901 [Campylobacter coli]